MHVLPLCELYSIALPQGHNCASSSSSRLLAHILFLAGPGPVHEIAVSTFSRSPLLGCAHVILFHFSLPSILRISLSSVPPLSPCFLALACPLFISFLFSSVLYPANLLYSYYSISCLFPLTSIVLPYFLVSSPILSYFLDYAIPCGSGSPFGYFLPYSPIS